MCPMAQRSYPRPRHPEQTLSIHAVMTYRRQQRFWRKVASGEDDACWPWLGGRSSTGYGLVQGCVLYVRYSFGAHRVAWALANGRDPDVVQHACDNPLCCNPAHLRDGDYRDNMQDAKRKGRLKVPRRQTTAEQRAQGVEMRRQGMTLRAIGDHFGIDWRNVEHWCRKAGLAAVRGPYAQRRVVSTVRDGERALPQSRRHVDGPEGRAGAQHVETERGAVAEAGFSPGERLESALGPGAEPMEAEKDG